MKLTATNSAAVSIAGIGMAALLVGCTSAGSSSSPPSPTTSSATSGGAVAGASGASGSSAATAPGSGTTPSGSAPGGSASAPATGSGSGGGLAILPCKTSELKVTAGTAGAAAGSLYQQIVFTNTSGRKCTLYGYPGVSLTTSTTPGSQVGAAATRSNAKPKAVITLDPRATASATLQITQVLNYPTSSCGPKDTRYLQVYPPGQTAAAYLAYQSKGCTKPVFVLGVTTIVAGG